MIVKMFKKATSVLLAVIMCLSTFIGLGATTAYAAEEVTDEVVMFSFPRNGDQNYDEYWGNKELHFMNGWFIIEARKVTVYTIGSWSGNVCYCIEPGTSLSVGDAMTSKDEHYWDNYPSTYNKTISSDDIKLFIGRIMQYGYTGKVTTSWVSQNEEDANKIAHIMATQTLIWETVVGERDADFNHVDTGDYDAVKDQVSKSHFLYDRYIAYYNSIEKSVKSHAKAPSFFDKSSSKAQDVELAWNGKNYSATLTDTNNVLSNYTFSANQSGITFSVSGNKLTITASSAPSKKVSITATKNGSTRKGIVVWSDGVYKPGSGQQDLVTYSAEVNDPVKGYLNIKVSLGGVKIVKTSEDDKVSGISFTITGNGVNKTVTTGANGEITIDDLSPGTYTVTENAADHYEAQSPKTVTVVSGQTATVSFNNTLKRGDLKIVKTSEDGKVDGVSFTISGNGVNKTVKTNKNGEIKIEGLLPGTYTVTEQSESYYEPQSSKTVTVKYDQTATVSFDNVLKRGDLTVTKTSEDGLTEGVKFRLTGTSDSGVKINITATVDNSGKAYFKDILIGSGYLLEEVDTALKYIVPDSQDVEIEWTKVATTEVYNQLKRGDLKVVKTSEDGLVEGMKFRLYGTSLSGEKVDVYTYTDKNGVAVFDDILIGENYTVEEVETAERYIIPDSQNVVIEWNKVTQKSFYNELKRGDLKVVKTSEDGFVEGMKFHLYGTSLSGEKVNVYAYTDKNGVAVFDDILIGENYTVEEVNTAIRYVIPDSQSVVVQWNEVTEAKFHNVLKKWRAETEKLDSETDNKAQGNATLEGAVYGVYKDGVLIDTYTTDKNGYFITDYYPCYENVEWTIREISPSEGYLLDDTVYYPDTDAGHYTIELNTAHLDVYEDIIQGKITIIKHTDDGSTNIETPEVGAMFEVYLKSAGSYEAAEISERDILTCDEFGYAETVDLPYGIYVVKQIKGLEGVDLMKPFEVFISEPWIYHRLIINNAPFTSYVKIQKTDAESGLAIPYAGAAFQLYNPDGTKVSMEFTYPEHTVIDTFYTNEDGYLITPETLGYGKDYYLVEVKAPYGYVLNSDPVYFDVTADDATDEGGLTIVNVTRSNMPQKGVIHITKTGEVFQSVVINDQMHKPVYEVKNLAGAVFEIRAAEDIYTLDGVMHYAKGELVDTITTGSDGIATSKELYLGKYDIQEVTAPHSMVLNGKVQTVELVYAGQEISITETSGNLYNERQKVKVSLEKALEQNELFGIGMNAELKNITFGLYAQTDIVAADGTKIPEGGLIEIIIFDENGKAVISTDLPLGRYYVQERSTDDHYILSDEKFGFEFTYGDQTVEVIELAVNNGAAIENELKYGSVSGLKVDEDGKVIKGAVFGLFSNDENEYTRENAYMVTESAGDGTFKFENIPYGTWVVREIQPAVGFVLNEKAYQITIKEDGDVVKIKLENRYIRGNIEGLKLDEDGNVIAGAKFGLFKPGTTEFTEENAVLVTESDSEGKFRFEDIRFGKWIVRELVPATGYVLNETPVEVNIQTEGEIINISFENKFIRSDIKGYKVDEDGKPVEGALFGLFTETDTEFTEENAVLTAKSDADGIFFFDDIRFGKWIVKELAPAEGFVANDTVFPIDVTTDGAVIEINAENRHIYGMVHTTKVDKDYPDNLLAGAIFEIYMDVDGNKEFNADVDTLVGEMVEYEPGLYELENLRYGGYFLYEKQAPANYVKDDAYHYFAIVNDGEMVEVENEAGIGFINNHMVGNLKIVKSSSDGRVEGFSFRVTGENYDEVFKTDANGEIFIEGLRIGKYTVTEVEDEVSAGYKRPDPVEVELVADETLTVNVHNDKITIEEPPKTGDESNMALWFGLLALSCFGMVGTVIYGRRRKREDAEV